MPRIVSQIDSLAQHRATLAADPERYRPAACPCGVARPWAHGCYTRKADRPPTGTGDRNPIPIPRFRCRDPNCGRTCSRLPSCLPPRRWYLWSVQQALLLALLLGVSLRAAVASHSRGPSRSTLRRWREWLAARGAAWAFRLKGRFGELARLGDGAAFWRGVFDGMGLAGAMTALDGLGEVVP